MKGFNTLFLILGITFCSLSTEARDLRGNRGKDSIFEKKKACAAAFSYEYQRTECELFAGSAKAVEYCTEAYNYDYQKFDCLKSTKEDESKEGHGRPDHNNEDSDLDILRACNNAFTYDYKRKDCVAQTVGDASAVRECTAAFSYDYQRFDCLKTAQTGELVRYCSEAYNYDYQIFDCMKK